MKAAVLSPLRRSMRSWSTGKPGDRLETRQEDPPLFSPVAVGELVVGGRVRTVRRQCRSRGVSLAWRAVMERDRRRRRGAGRPRASVPTAPSRSALGGAPFNTARACGRLGADVRFAGSISVDRFGSMLIDQLAADRVATDLVVRCEEPTTLAVAELDERGAASYRFYVDGTSAPAFSTLARRSARHAVHRRAGARVGTDGDDGRGDRRPAAGEAVTVMVDVNAATGDRRRSRALPRTTRARAGRADVVKVSDEDLAYLTPGEPPVEAARGAAGTRRRPRAVLLTAGGRRGAWR